MNTEISGFSSPSRQEHMNQVLAPMVAVSRDGIITYANTRAVKDFDHNLPENIINRHINEFLSVKDQNRFREILKETVAASKKLENGEKITAPVVDYEKNDLKIGKMVKVVLRKVREGNHEDVLVYGIKLKLI